MIRSIVYLDEPKFFSLSSQIFEGLTEYLLDQKSHSEESSEAQKGPIASGRALADAMKSTQTSTEKRVLHDYAFNIFEEKLVSAGPLADITVTMAEEEVRELLSGKSFIRIRAKATFIDAVKLTSMFGEFNEVGEALAYVTGKDAVLNGLNATAPNSKKAINEQKVLEAIRANARASGLHQDPRFLASLARLTQFGYSDQLEIQQIAAGIIFLSSVKREHLRETVDLLMRKYARRTEKEFVVLGLITQSLSAPKPNKEGTDEKPGNMKKAIGNMINAIADVEDTFSGKGEDEVVIDPIAVYVPL